MQNNVVRLRRTFVAGQDFDQQLDLGTGKLESVRLVKSIANPSADDLLACEELEALEVCLERCVFWVRCQGESDEIMFSDDPEWSTPSVINLTSEEPWSTALGLELKSYGFLTKGDDYRDRLQLEFGGSKGQASIQIEFAACRVLFYKVISIRE